MNVAKALSIILVAFYHACVWLPLGDSSLEPSSVAGAINSAAYDFRMPVFFVAAGLFVENRVNLQWSEFFSRKLAFLIWPFLIWQVVILGYKLAADLGIEGRDGSFLRQIGMTALTLLRPNGESWFLWALALYLIATKLLLKVSTPWVLAISAIVSFVWSGFVIPELPNSVVSLLGPGLLNVLQYFVFFVAAARFGPLIIRAFLALNPLICIALVGLWVLYATIEFSHFEPTFIGQILAVTAGLALARLLERSKTLEYLGGNTLPVYLVHTVVIVAVTITISQLGINLEPGVLAWAPAAVTVVALIIAGRLQSRLADSDAG